MKKITVNIFIITICLFFLSCFPAARAETYSPKEDSSNHPLQIESLRNSYPKGSHLTIKNTLQDTPTLTNKLISYEVEGLVLNALLSIPKQKKPSAGFPVIILNHGHIQPQKYSTLNSYKYVADYFAADGFLVLKPDYRGHAQSESGSELHGLERLAYPIDVLALLSLVPEIAEADPDNIFMYGHSMGGQITLTVLEVTDQIKAASLWAPVSEQFPESSLYFIRRRDSKLAEERLKVYKKIFGQENFVAFSLSAYTHLIQTPLIIHHGTKDESVPYSWTVNLLKILDKNNVDYIFHSYENENHNLSKYSFYNALKRDVAFFREHIAP
ncbi:MAG: alpha/beta fold hydrolase [Spirochaetales bacterium]|nr:alpha/beta fold hydrolase [Spirochaetales bacterium]